MTREYLAVHDRLSCAEIVLILDQDAGWCLPRWCRRWRQRMDEAWAVVKGRDETARNERRVA